MSWPRIEELFNRAAELPPDQREAFLDAECPDGETRAEVESLLAYDDSPGARLQHAVAGAAEAIIAAKSEWLTGRHVGPYRITGVIGEGGMGAVYSAVRDDDQYSKQVAIKLVKCGFETSRSLERFRAERQILSALEHPYIARMLDGGATADGYPYLVMERIEGLPITAYARGKKLSVEARLRLFQKVCEAVQYAHANLVVHRDIKPSNIHVTGDGTPKLLDFGIARLLTATETSGLQTSTVLITPDYASPEQVMGKVVTTATDIYSLGVVLYELLTGDAPHRLGGRTPAEALTAICTTEPDLPSKRSPQLASDVDNIVMMALRKEPERRYRSVEQFSEDIQRYLDGRPVIARAATFSYRAGKFMRRNRVAVTAAFLVAASLVAGISVALVQARRAERRFQQVRKLANTFLFSFHDQIQNLPGATPAREMVVKTATEYLDSLAAEAGSDAVLQEELATAYLRVARVQGDPRTSNLGQPQAALASLGKVVQITGRILQANPDNRGALRTLAAAHGQAGDIEAISLGNVREGINEYEKCLEAAQTLCRRADPELADLQSLSRALLLTGDYMLDFSPAKSIQLYRQAMEAAGRIAKVAPEAEAAWITAQNYQHLGTALHDVGDPEAGIKAYQEAGQRMRKLLDRDPNSVRYRREMAHIDTFIGCYTGHPEYFHFGQPAAAIAYFRKASVVLEQIAAADPKDSRAQMDRALTAGKIAKADLLLDPAEALREGRRALSIVDAMLMTAPNDVRIRRVRQSILATLGAGFLLAKNPGEAVRVYKESLDIAQSQLMRKPRDNDLRAVVQSAQDKLGAAYLAAKDWENAGIQLRQANEIAEQLRQAGPADLYFLRDLALTQEHMGQHSEGLGQSEEARDWYRRSLDSWQAWRKQSGHDIPFLAAHEARLKNRLAN